MHRLARRTLLPLLPLVLMLGCSATGPRFVAQPTPTDGQGLLYIYRPDASPFKARTALIEVDGRPVASLKNAGYTVLRLPAGPHQVTQQWAPWFGDNKALDKPLSLTVDLPSNGQVYVKLGVSSTSRMVTGGQLQQQLRWMLRVMPADQALPEIAETSLVAPELKPAP